MKTTRHSGDRFDVRPFATEPRRRNVRRPRPAPFGLTHGEAVTLALMITLVTVPAIAAVLYFAANLGNR